MSVLLWLMTSVIQNVMDSFLFSIAIWIFFKQINAIANRGKYAHYKNKQKHYYISNQPCARVCALSLSLSLLSLIHI